MTKEELSEWVKQAELKMGVKGLTKLFNEFFESNVCIPKGENRRPEADVLHELIENGGSLTYKLSTSECGFTLPDDAYDISIKLSDPIYEWQWYWVEDGIATIANDGMFMTDNEANIDTPIWYKFEQTMKERK